jgi:hypothetical protein
MPPSPQRRRLSLDLVLSLYTKPRPTKVCFPFTDKNHYVGSNNVEFIKQALR